MNDLGPDNSEVLHSEALLHDGREELESLHHVALLLLGDQLEEGADDVFVSVAQDVLEDLFPALVAVLEHV